MGEVTLPKFKVISVRQPWANLIVYWDKAVENRTWNTEYRGPVIIHASKVPDPKGTIGWDLLAWRSGVRADDSYDLARSGSAHSLALGAAVGVCNLVHVDRDILTDWDARGQYHFRLTNRKAFLKPVKMRGRLSLFDPPDEVLEAAHKAWMEAHA
jgi:hypothetical protein